MFSLNQRGAIQFIILLILLAGVVTGVYLVQKTQILKPKASVSGPITPTTSFTLSPNTSIANIGGQVEVKVVVRSDIAAANLFNAKINFNKDILEVDKIGYLNTFISNWVEQSIDNLGGTISLVGGVPNPGYQTTTGNEPGLMAVVYFKTLKTGTANIAFADASAIYSNADNIDILTFKDSIDLSIVSGGVPWSSPTPTPTSTPTSCSACAADISKNGRVSAVDYSSAVTCFSRGISSKDGAGRVCLLSDIDQNGVIDQKDIDCITSQFGNTCAANAIASPSPSPSVQIAIPTQNLGLKELSGLLSDFNKRTGYKLTSDLNLDKIVNSIDFSLMRDTLITNGVVKVN